MQDTNLAPQRAQPASFSILTPGNWIVVDLESLSDEEVVTAQVDERLAEEPALIGLRDDLVATIVRTARGAREAGALLAAVLATVGPGGAPIVANVTVASVEDRGFAERVAVSLPDVGGPADGGSGREGDTAPTIVLNAVNDDDGGTRLTPAIVELPAGAGLRTEGLEEVEMLGSGLLQCLVVQHILPVPATDDRFVVLTFTSPSVGRRADLTELFAHIAETFAWV